MSFRRGVVMSECASISRGISVYLPSSGLARGRVKLKDMYSAHETAKMTAKSASQRAPFPGQNSFIRANIGNARAAIQE